MGRPLDACDICDTPRALPDEAALLTHPADPHVAATPAEMALAGAMCRQECWDTHRYGDWYHLPQSRAILADLSSHWHLSRHAPDGAADEAMVERVARRLWASPAIWEQYPEKAAEHWAETPDVIRDEHMERARRLLGVGGGGADG